MKHRIGNVMSQIFGERSLSIGIVNSFKNLSLALIPFAKLKGNTANFKIDNP